MKKYSWIMFSISLGLLILCLFEPIWPGIPFNWLLGGLDTFWGLSTIYFLNELRIVYNKPKEEYKSSLAYQVSNGILNQSTTSIYTQFNGLTPNEIIWLTEHLEDQKEGLIRLNTTNSTDLKRQLNTMINSGMPEQLIESMKKDINTWEEFYLKASTNLANILPKITLLKEVVE